MCAARPQTLRRTPHCHGGERAHVHACVWVHACACVARGVLHRCHGRHFDVECLPPFRDGWPPSRRRRRHLRFFCFFFLNSTSASTLSADRQLAPWMTKMLPSRATLCAHFSPRRHREPRACDPPVRPPARPPARVRTTRQEARQCWHARVAMLKRNEVHTRAGAKTHVVVCLRARLRAREPTCERACLRGCMRARVPA